MYSLYIVLPSCSIWLQRNWMNNCLRRFTTLLQQSILNRSRSRRLSKVYCLNHFFNLFDPDRNESWREYLIASKYDITSMTDVFKIFNEVNLQLQGYELNLIRIKTVIAALGWKLPLFKRNLRRGEYNHFPTSSTVSVIQEDLFTFVHQCTDWLKCRYWGIIKFGRGTHRAHN